ncbi:MAG: hypothetical protein ACREHD_15575, partial [Pirellulales bacterium]
MLLVAVAAAVGVPLFYQRFDEEVRRRVEAKIAAHYPNLMVSVRAARFLAGKGIEIRGVSIFEPNISGPTAELAYIEELLLEGDTDWQDLLRGELRIRRVVFRRPTIRIAHRPDDTWSAAKLLPLPRLSKDPPRGTIENGVVEILDPLKQQGGALIIRDAQLAFEPASVDVSTNNAQVPVADNRRWLGQSLASSGSSTRQDGGPAMPRQPAHRGIAAEHPNSVVPDPAAAALPQPPPTLDSHCAPLRVHGHFVADHLQRVEIDATLEPSGKEWSVQGSLDGLDFSPEFVRALPAALSRRLAELGSLRSTVQSRFYLAHHADAQSGLVFDIAGRISRGRIDDPRLPYPLTDLRAAFRLNNREMAITDVTARNGQTTLALDLHRQGYQKQSPYTLVAKSRHMVFDSQLRSILPFDWQGEWHKFLPAGEFDADLKLVYDGKTWRPELIIGCRNVSFSYHKFPYRLERAQGRLELVDGLLKIDLKAFTEGEEVRVFGEFRNPGAKAVGKVNIHGDSIRLDEKLFLALSENGRRIVRSLNPRGTFHFSFDFWHGRESQPQIHKKLTITLNRCSLRYDLFPYPLDNIRGTIAMQDDMWEYKDLQGTNDTGTVECHGRLVPRT